jgi:hypothetical protein
MPSLLFMSMEPYIKKGGGREMTQTLYAHINKRKKKERGLINSDVKSVKDGQKILKLLKPVWAPKQVEVMHC